MNISLTPELEQFVLQKVESGLYTSASEVVRESLRLLNKHEALQLQQISQLNHEIERGLLEFAQGNHVSAKHAYDQLKNKIESIGNRGHD